MNCTNNETFKNGRAVQDWEKAEREIRKNETEPKTDAKAETPPDLTPQLVKRVHELYEELGREDVRAVQNWDKAERETRKDESHK